ncbi:MAG: D-alanine--D-alanine ligase family protein [Anaerolineae bacterium]|nr:D-alanine--D-alanine ligase family protein [Anaerolineae bacterium]MDW8292963.1 D-alanine--D-alanine ligase family protein [Anaerolineae bacterium]
MAARLRVAVLYGGQSGEHDVSVLSAQSVMAHLDTSRYEVAPIYITRDGRWPIPLEQLRAFDVVFPVLHGPMGEDGTVQGLLTLLGVPFVGAGVTGSAVGMDKAIFKDVMRAHGLPVPPSIVVRRHEWLHHPEAVQARALREIGLPCFVKPACLGSSIGVSKVKTQDAFSAAMDEAFRWDRKVLIERAVPKARELEVSVLGNDTLRASVVGEIIPSREFYDYAAKYLDSGERASRLLIPAPLPEAVADWVRTLALHAAEATEARGMARVDFLVDGERGEVFISEINTIPGFTPISMYPKLWEASGVPYAELLNTLIALALER